MEASLTKQTTEESEHAVKNILLVMIQNMIETKITCPKPLNYTGGKFPTLPLSSSYLAITTWNYSTQLNSTQLN